MPFFSGGENKSELTLNSGKGIKEDQRKTTYNHYIYVFINNKM